LGDQFVKRPGGGFGEKAAIGVAVCAIFTGKKRDCGGIGDEGVAADAGDDDGLGFGDFVEVGAGGESFFAEFVVVEAMANEPAGGAANLQSAQAGEKVVEAGAADQVGLAEEHFAEGIEVDVGVDEAGEDGFAFEVDVMSGGMVFELAVGAEGENLAVFYGQCSREGKTAIEGDEMAVGQKKIGMHGIVLPYKTAEDTADTAVAHVQTIL
jgi:hypothetical protein